MRKKSTKNELSSDDFFEHFKNLFSNEETFKNNFVEERLNSNDTVYNNVDELDMDFTVDDVIKDFSSLKSGRSADVDKLIPEIFIGCKTISAPILCKLFNHIIKYK